MRPYAKVKSGEKRETKREGGIREGGREDGEGGRGKEKERKEFSSVLNAYLVCMKFPRFTVQ